MSPNERALRARIAAHASWAKTADRSARTAPARRAQLDRFEARVDPDGILDPVVRARMAESARKEYFTRLAYRSAQARRRGKATPGRTEGQAGAA
ncbi:hypothetical protein ACI8AV_13675 [Geodermatophilus sp. SYSU D00804]